MERLKKLFLSHQSQFFLLLVLFIVLRFLSELLYPDLVLDETLICFLLWLASISLFRLSGQFSIKIALVFLCLMPFLIILKAEEEAEKVGSLFYGLLLVGIIQEFIVYLKKRKKIK